MFCCFLGPFYRILGYWKCLGSPADRQVFAMQSQANTELRRFMHTPGTCGDADNKRSIGPVFGLECAQYFTCGWPQCFV